MRPEALERRRFVATERARRKFPRAPCRLLGRHAGDERLDDGARMTTQQKATELLRSDALTERMLKAWQGLPLGQYETLVESRYTSQKLKAGIVWKEAELKSIFKLTDAQVKLYREFRAAIDKSLTGLAISDMVRYGGKDIEDVKDAAMAAKTVEEASTMLRDYLMTLSDGSERKDVLIDMAGKMIEKSDRARELMDQGYAPLSRFGTHSLDVVDAAGERVYFGLFESKAEATKMARRMAVEFPKAAITQGTTSEQAYKLFAGVSPETLELFGEMLGLESQGDDASSKAFQEYLKLARSSRSAMKRLIQRKGKAGETLLPVAGRNLMKAADMATTGLYRDEKGRKVLDVGAYDVLAKGIGFQPNDVARVQDATRTAQNLIGQVKLRETEIADKWALGMFEQDQDKVASARADLKAWNENNPDAPIRIQMPQIIKRVRAMRMSKADRIAATAPKEIRANVKKELAAAD